ncbi:MAG: NINE protein [Treponema sp.]|jgi:TM2 domain-containing membrane protein YozV|nr:NINE protein [Treponema sp.]
MYSVGMAYLLWVLSGFGVLGFHRFYLGKIATGLLWMFSGGLGMIGAIYDLFTLPGQVREANIRLALDNAPAWIGRGAARRQEQTGENWRYADDIQARVVRGKENLEHCILKLAKENKGILTVSDVALGAEISLEDAKKALETLVKQGFAELRVRKSGTLVYTLPEFMDKDENLEDF